MRSNAEPTGTQSVRNLLNRLGLEQRETEIYLALLPLKIGKVSKIAKVAKQPRTLTYIVLQNLEEKGLVSRVLKSNIQHFVAESPERLVSFAHDQSEKYSQLESLLSNAMPLLHSLRGPLVGEPRVSLLKGEAGMRQVYKDALRGEVRGCGNAKAMWDTYGCSAPEYAFGSKFQNFTMKGKDLLVDNKEAEWFVRDNPKNEFYEARILPSSASFIADSLIYNDTIAIFAYDEELTIVQIENKNIADLFSNWHEVLWSVSTPIA